MKRMHKVFMVGLLVLALVPGLAAAYPVTISGYVGMNNTGASALAYPTMLQGWTVDLRYNVDSYGSILQTTTTDVNGYYTFSVNAQNAMYRTILTVQPTYKAANPSAALLGISVTSTTTDYPVKNFSVYKLPQVTIQGHKYLDPDGKHTSTAYPLTGWTIQLTNTGGTVLASTTTDTDGAYSLQVPDFGVTYVKEVDQAGYTKTWPTGAQFSHTITKGQVASFTDDFWNAHPMSVKISGHKYLDPDGKYTDTSTGIAGWTMKLLQQQVTDYVEIASTTTDASGYYEFTGINAVGHYVVQEVPQAGYKASNPVTGQRGFILDYTSPDQVADFWNYVLPSVTISGHKYSDPDGKHTDKSTPLAGVTMELYLGLVKQTETTTDASGAYSFTVNDLGSWRVSEVVPTGYTQTWPYNDYGFMILPGAKDPIIDQDFWNKPDQAPEPEPVPVPEFPTIAVSILTISGMFIAVQFMKKRN